MKMCTKGGANPLTQHALVYLKNVVLADLEDTEPSAILPLIVSAAESENEEIAKQAVKALEQFVVKDPLKYAAEVAHVKGVDTGFCVQRWLWLAGKDNGALKVIGYVFQRFDAQNFTDIKTIATSARVSVDKVLSLAQEGHGVISSVFSKLTMCLSGQPNPVIEEFIAGDAAALPERLKYTSLALRIVQKPK